MSCTVSIPYLKEMPYTLFVKGLWFSAPQMDKNEDFLHFKLSEKNVFVLFYTFAEFRRAYIVTCHQDEYDGESILLPSVDKKLRLIFKARGRKIDDLKRVLYILMEEQDDERTIFTLPVIFWYRLSALIKNEGASRSDISILWESFTNRKLVKLSKKERKARQMGISK